MRFSTVIILLLVAAITGLVFYIYYVPPKIITIVERPVYEYGVSWRPWSWGGGGWGWPGASYINRPMPDYYGRPGHGRREYDTGGGSRHIGRGPGGH